MKPLLEVLDPPPPASTYCVAYSGGLDSTVLLHLARAAGLPGLQALHVHHDLQDEADTWAEHCAWQCAQLQVPFTLLRVTVPSNDPQGPEAAARRVRYAAMRAALPAGALLLTAHHAGDQAETVLLRLLRGTGVEGLAAMSMQTVLDDLPLWRPLLKTPRRVLRAYAESQRLRWIEDPHNAAPRFARSWLRTQLMPVLDSRWPDADTQLGRAAEHAADASYLLARLAAQRLAVLREANGGLSVSGLSALEPAERRLVLRHWLMALRLPVPAAEVLEHLHRDVLCAAPDATPLLRWPGVECRRYRDTLYAGTPLPVLPENLLLEWDGEQPLTLPYGLGTLSSARPQAMQVSFALPGVRLRPTGQPHHRSLKQLAQAAGVPPWWRVRLPIILVNRTVVSIAGRWNTSEDVAIRWQIKPKMGLPADWHP